MADWKCLKTFVGVVALLGFGVLSASAQIVSDTRPENTLNGFLGDPVYITGSGHPFNFTGQTLPATFAEIQFSMGLYDGDTGGPGSPTGYSWTDFDFDNLTLFFEGADNGSVVTNPSWKLNGFRNEQYDYRTFTFTADPVALTNLIYSNPTGIYARFHDVTVGDNFWNFRDPSGNIYQTTLKFGSAGTLTVPEPGMVTMLGGMGVSSLLFTLRRRRAG